MTLSFSLLGHLRVTVDGKPARFATDYVRALLAYLVVEAQPEGRVYPRTTLAALLWPEQPEPVARHNLRQALLHLRQALRDFEELPRVLEISAKTLQFNVRIVAVDVHHFQQHVAACAAHSHTTPIQCPTCILHLQQAADLYQGEFLHALFLKGSQPFEEWALYMREQLHRQAVQTFHTLTVYHAAVGAYEQMQHYATRQLALEPWREEAHRQLMQAFVLSGQGSAALAQYAVCRRILLEELGEMPSPETTALYEQIKTGTFGRSTKVDKVNSDQEWSIVLSPMALSQGQRRTGPPPHNLLAQLTPLADVNAELAEISARLQQPEIRLLTLVGTGGMGKTRLALAAAKQIVDDQLTVEDSNINHRFADGVFFVSLAPLTDPATLATTIATTLSLNIYGDPHQRLIHYLRDKCLLLILDNFEHLLEGAEIVVAILQAAPLVQIMATSRQRLGVRGEHLYVVQALDYAPDAPLTMALTSSSVRLFEQSAEQAQTSFKVNTENLSAVLRICQLVQGMPLGLELASAAVGTLPLNVIATEIAQSAAFLAVDWREVPERQRSMRAVFDWSWRLLDDEERRVLRQLSVFRDGFTHDAAQAVTGAPWAVLGRLVHKSLVFWDERQGANGRYTIHELLRQLAAAQLSADESTDVETQHSQFYLSYVAARAIRLARHEPQQASEEIRSELDNIRQAWSWAATHACIAELDQAAFGWWQFCILAGMEFEGQRTFDLAIKQAYIWLEQLNPGDPARQNGQRLLSKLLAIHANYLFAQGQDERMAAQAREAIALGATSGGVAGETFGYFVLGRALQDLEQRREASAMWERTIQLARAYQGDHADSELLYEAEWMAHSCLRGYLLYLGDYPSGRAYMVQALHICQSLGKRRGELDCLSDLAWTNLFMGDYVAAKYDLEKALHLALTLSYRHLEMWSQQGLGEVMCLRGEYSQAQALLERAAMLSSEMGLPYHEAFIWARLVRLHSYLGDQEGARQWGERLSQLLTTMKLPKECHLHGLLAYALKAHYAGEHEAALTYAEQAYQIIQIGEILNRRADALVILGYPRVSMNYLAEAEVAYEEAILCYDKLGNASLTVEPQAGLAEIALRQGNYARAQTLVDTILVMLDGYPPPSLNEPFRVYLICYQVLTANHDQRAVTLLGVAHNLLHQYADHITDDALRHSFLADVSVHRALQEAYGQCFGLSH